MSDITIELYTDINCPWCLIGQHRLDKVLADRFPEVSADVVHYPVFLMPDCPPEGVRIKDLLKSKYGIVDPTEAWARPEAEARASGLDLDLSKQEWAFPTQVAQTLVRVARDKGTQHPLAVALARAHFLDARNISDVPTLIELTRPHGFSADEVTRLAADGEEIALTVREAAIGAQHGVRSVPQFNFPGDIILIGGRSEDEISAAIKQALHS